MKKRILVSRLYPEAGLKLLETRGFHLTIWEKQRPMTQAELIEKTKNHNALLCTLTDKIDHSFLKKCSHLEIISQFAVGYDNIDIASATRCGIPVGFTPGAMTQATADIAFGLMIAVARKMFYLHKTIINGKWGYFNPVGNLGIELKNKTLGIFGLGRIGSEMGRLCKNAYDMDIIYHNQKPNKTAEKLLDAAYVDFNDLLAQSDILSAHSTLTPETEEIFNRSAFEKMKSSAIFINTARGSIHNEKDLINALKQGSIQGAGLDVTNPEPMQKDNPLLFMENACVLPHTGSGTIEARNQMSVLAALNIIEFYKTGAIPHVVNPEVLQ